MKQILTKSGAADSPLPGNTIKNHYSPEINMSDAADSPLPGNTIKKSLMTKQVL